MAYKYLNDDGLKAYTKKVKGALKDLHTPIAISSENTTESKAQNVRNINDFVAKAKAAGIADVNGMVVTCNIDTGDSGVGNLYLLGDGSYLILCIATSDDLYGHHIFRVTSAGEYTENNVVVNNRDDQITSLMLDRGARKPIILTPSTTEVDEETYQKLLSDDVDVVLKTDIAEVQGNLCTLTYKTDNGDYFSFHFTCFSREGESFSQTYFYGYEVRITKTGNPHPCRVVSNNSEETDFESILLIEGFISKYILSPVLQEIDLRGTDAERKTKLDQFETDWKALTGANDMKGARFMGRVDNSTGEGGCSVLFTFDCATNVLYYGCTMLSDTDKKIVSYRLNKNDGSLSITPLFSHLEPVEIFTDNSAESKKKNIDNLNAYKSNLEELGVNTANGFQMLIKIGNDQYGMLANSDDLNNFKGYSSGFGKMYTLVLQRSSGAVISSQLQSIMSNELVTSHKAIVPAINEVSIIAKAVRAFGVIELKASDNAANKAALTAYKRILTDAGISITNGYSVSVRITGNTQEYHGMLNIGTGTLLSGIVTDVNENHYYPFNVNTTDGAITFDANNYFLEKTSNEVTEMLDAIKYSYTQVPLTTTTSTNKTQLNLFLSKVPNAQVMHCTYKDVYAGTLHKINGSWYGVLVGESNTLAGQLSIKLQADGTVVEGTA